ncbi:MAG: hypothetical protein GC204_11875 [Chloroflexi bacterium]|nr:hypothetical protein [Chloroflexota bacterium]
MKVVRSVTHDWIIYLDDDGKTCFVDLIACNNRWIINKRDAGEGVSTLDARYVAYHKSIGKPQHVVFFSEPPIKFEFEADDAYWKFLDDLSDARWRTIDLS